ncbi:PadR family transcriptional regulator [Sporolactobacillus sp. CPB3-1]|uniref:PadR family transcriptional regulator n=1 Tax=Sporolactobacillus mangiferae TaxID=2940498 RepID=A0ABT0MD78_9BACL|nr:helix-turn-helix transcriptional regulator [Sporolactobacillus mangiferae]MCL1632829.1 PadR family transcriptional regulator [Sporolactobacillus mangiferae]
MPESSERGALTEAVYYILLSLYTPMHGYGVMQKVKEMSGGRVALGAGTLYGALNTLLQKEWIRPHASPSSRKKEYEITPAGKAVIHNELLRLKELLRNGEKTIGGDRNE